MSKTWNDITIYDYALKSRFADEAQKMLDLVSELRNHPDFTDVQSFTSLLTLMIEIPGKRNRIGIFWEPRASMYEVYIEPRGRNFRNYFIYVKREDVVSKLREYVELIKANILEIALDDMLFQKLEVLAR